MNESPLPRTVHLSATSIKALKSCPMKLRLGYVEGLRPDRDTESQRCGTNWHALHETYANALSAAYTASEGDLEELAGEIAMEAVLNLLNERYADVPSWIDAHAWALERQILLTSFIGYLWYWQNDQVEFLASEVPFNLPVHEPRTGMPLSMKSVQRVGKIDHIVKWHDGICALERKSTSRSIASDSDYWQTWNKDTQISMYALAFADLKGANLLPDSVRYDVAQTEALGGTVRYGNTLVDAWHKPTIRPCMLTQAETKVFLETGVYQEQQFAVMQASAGQAGSPLEVTVNGVRVEVEQGKKGFAIKETIEMFAARLLQDIYARPEFYFARREIARTADEIRQFRGELFSIYQIQKLFTSTGHWFSNESQCRATFACPYIPICYGPGASAVCESGATPPGFKRIFVNLTVNGREVEE
jgi:hypothetical protein